MNSVNSNDTYGSVHSDVWDLMPWYVNGTLEDREISMVKAHMLECRLCRDEFDRCQNTMTAVHHAREDAWQATPDGLDRLMNQIDHQARSGKTTFAGLGRHIQIHFAKTKVWIDNFLNTPNWRVAIPAVLVFGLGIGIVLQGVGFGVNSQGTDPAFQTLTSQNHRGTTGEHFQVIFEPNAATADISRLLHDINGQIVDGPSERGVFTVSLTETNDDTSGAILDRLKNAGAVMFAEPVKSESE